MTREQFINGIHKCDDWNNHLILLWLALEETSIGSVMEFGCGDGSTRQLHEYCLSTGRKLYSFETDPMYINRFTDCKSDMHEFHHIRNWDSVQQICSDPSVILIDHAPGERRWVDIKNYCNKADIIIVHDSQPPPTAADYKYENVWSMFKYRVDLQVDKHESGDNRTWATAISNKYDVSKWAGKETGNPQYRLV